MNMNTESYLMKEPEVSLRIALYHIYNNLTNQDIKVSIDGAHIKTNNTINFDIYKFLKENQLINCDANSQKWQGTYQIEGYRQKIIISSKPGEGDVVIKLNDGRTLYIESKKIKKGKSNNEYPAMREAIGQLMTGLALTENIVPAVGIPYSPKSLGLAERWSMLPQMKAMAIHFILVYKDGSIKMI